MWLQCDNRESTHLFSFFISLFFLYRMRAARFLDIALARNYNIRIRCTCLRLYREKRDERMYLYTFKTQKKYLNTKIHRNTERTLRLIIVIRRKQEAGKIILYPSNFLFYSRKSDLCTDSFYCKPTTESFYLDAQLMNK